ncbi:MAG TPA: hypothetical protein GX391_03075 [Firmicutes bacterium]|jgi:hypothetical protein|nr:hypothetical protein [Bacillota bacterium]HOQ23883.1 hypothetical protein [Bacillota bacterium]HPT67134.1 hypothetical protein [Bacillota bacterium]
MANVSISTLMCAIQALNGKFKELEQLLTSETLRDHADIQDLIFSYEKALNELKKAYLEELPGVDNYPSYEELIK